MKDHVRFEWSNQFVKIREEFSNIYRVTFLPTEWAVDVSTKEFALLIARALSFYCMEINRHQAIESFLEIDKKNWNIE